MKRNNVIGITAAAAVIVLSVVLISRYLDKRTPLLIQGTVECTTYKASSKVPGRIDEMKVEEGDRVEKGQLLYMLSTPELEAKLRQAEAVKSAAAALDAAAVAGARIQQIEAALNMWEKAQAGLELARKTYERVRNLYDDGVVPAQKLDEAEANYKAMEATALAAKAQYDLAADGARKEDKEAAAARVRQAEGPSARSNLYRRRDGLLARDGRGFDRHRRGGRAGGQRLSGGGHSRHVGHVGDIQRQGDAAPGHEARDADDGFVPALDRDVEFEVTYIAPQADFATWAATRTQGGFDIRTFAVKARPVSAAENMRPGMSVLVDWDKIGR